MINIIPRHVTDIVGLPSRLHRHRRQSPREETVAHGINPASFTSPQLPEENNQRITPRQRCKHTNSRVSVYIHISVSTYPTQRCKSRAGLKKNHSASVPHSVWIIYEIFVCCLFPLVAANQSERADDDDTSGASCRNFWTVTTKNHNPFITLLSEKPSQANAKIQEATDPTKLFNRDQRVLLLLFPSLRLHGWYLMVPASTTRYLVGMWKRTWEQQIPKG